MEIGDLLHKHSLELSGGGCGGLCFVCRRTIEYDDQVYTCLRCLLFIHKSCGELPPQIELFFHPCTLYMAKAVSEFQCNVCYGMFVSPVRYRCGECHFNLCHDCGKFYTKKSESGMQEDGEDSIQHFSHRHPLKFFEKKEDCEVARCEICGGLWSDGFSPFCGCRQCKFYIHKTCLDDLPQKVQHNEHGHPLVLLSAPYYQCHLCDLECYGGLSFRCGRCSLDYCVECILKTKMKFEGRQKIRNINHRHILKPCKESHVYHSHGFPSCYACGIPNLRTFRCSQCWFSMCVLCILQHEVKSASQETIRHDSHSHPLTMEEINDGKDNCCSICRNGCFGPTYICRACDFFLHKSCVELPQEVTCYLHLSHPFFPFNTDTDFCEKIRCSMCFEYCDGFAFGCEECDIQLHVDCLPLKATVQYEDHNHLLTVVDCIYDDVPCDSCKNSCFDKPAFSCSGCSFTLHLYCGPLPSIIFKDEFHLHPLILEDFCVGDNPDEYTDYICDACENKRDPRLCVYRCADCRFVSEFKCVITEVMASLRGECGDVELRIVGRKNTGMSKLMNSNVMERNKVEEQAIKIERGVALTVNEFLNSLTADETLEFLDVIAATESEMDRAINTTNEVSPCSDIAFAKLMVKLNSGIGSGSVYSYVLSEQYSNLVNYEDYVVPQIFVPIFKGLKSKYGDISAKCILSPRIKSLFFILLGLQMHSMLATKCVDIKEYMLHDWWTNSRCLKHAGFEVGFLFNHLEVIASTYFGLEAGRSEEIKRAKQKREIEELSEKIKRLQKEREAAEKDLETAKTQNAETAFFEPKSMKRHFANGWAWMWKPAAHGLL